MKALDHPLVADENIHPEVIAALVASGRDVVRVVDLGLTSWGDRAILERAHVQRRVVLTHDRDFGTLAVREGVAFTGIVFLRPGHLDPKLVLSMIDAVAQVEVQLDPPFIVVAELSAGRVRVRFRPTLARP